MYIIFGGSGGIGSKVASKLVADNKNVHLAARHDNPLQLAAAELGCSYTCADVTNYEEVKALISQISEAGHSISGILNSVGSIILKPAHLTSTEEFMETIKINTLSAFNCIKVVGQLVKNPCSLVLFSSCAARIGLANHEAIAAAKAGVEGLARSAAATYASRNIRVNVIAPGLVKTELSAKITANSKAAEYSTELHPLGRLGEPNDIAHIATFLLSPESSWITGQVFGIDGGLSTIKSTK